MKYLHFLTFILFIGISSLQAQNAINVESILFEYDKANLTDNSKFQLDEILKINNIDSIQLTGHTDSDGNDDYNLVLSKKRVFAVQNYLVQRDFPNDKIIVDYHGEHIPLTENSSEEGKQQNRRVEITIYFQPEPVVVEKVIKEEPKIIEIPQIDTVEKVAKILEDTTISIRGIQATLTKDDFYAYKGMPVFEPILTVEDAMKHGLNTMTTNGGLLVSDGMIRLNQSPSGNCFTKPIKVYFPVSSNIVGGKRKHYVLKNGAWKVGGKKRSIDIVQIDDVSYYEMTIVCYDAANGFGNYHNCDGGIGGSEHKLKLPFGYRLTSMTIQYNQPLAIYAFNNDYKRRKLSARRGRYKLKTDFELPCRIPNNAANIIIEAHSRKTGHSITKKIPFNQLKSSILKSKCQPKQVTKTLRGKIQYFKRRPSNKFKVKRKLLKA